MKNTNLQGSDELIFKRKQNMRKVEFYILLAVRLFLTFPFMFSTYKDIIYMYIYMLIYKIGAYFIIYNLFYDYWEIIYKLWGILQTNIFLLS